MRLVREEDAEFILRLRTDEKLARYLHATDDNVEKQVEWIKQYKVREAARDTNLSIENILSGKPIQL